MAKISPILFVKQVRQEMAKVTWPTRNETTVTLIMVLVLAAIMALFLSLTDTVLYTLKKYILG
jgi:preprotein translocase subunit SecE